MYRTRCLSSSRTFARRNGMTWQSSYLKPSDCINDPVDVIVAAAHSDPLAAEWLLSLAPDLAFCRSSWGETALQAASHVGHTMLLRRFLAMGAEMDLFATCAAGDLSAAMDRFAVKHRDARGVHGLPLLHFGVVSREISMVQELIDAGVEVNPRDAGIAPLHSAIAAGDAEITRQLLLAGANPEARDSLGATALDWAIELDGDGSRLVAILLDHGARTGSKVAALV
ncbi:MAG: ankyrin repeat domain-containing protein [Candidatus Dormiibacterota bacterium]